MCMLINFHYQEMNIFSKLFMRSEFHIYKLYAFIYPPPRSNTPPYNLLPMQSPNVNMLIL